MAQPAVFCRFGPKTITYFTARDLPRGAPSVQSLGVPTNPIPRDATILFFFTKKIFFSLPCLLYLVESEFLTSDAFHEGEIVNESSLVISSFLSHSMDASTLFSSAAAPFGMVSAFCLGTRRHGWWMPCFATPMHLQHGN
jgi:hypothetical protein